MAMPTIPNDLTASGLISLLQAYWGVKNDPELGRTLGKERGTIRQFREKGTMTDIKGAIILELLGDIAYLEKKLLDSVKNGNS